MSWSWWLVPWSHHWEQSGDIDTVRTLIAVRACPSRGTATLAAVCVTSCVVGTSTALRTTLSVESFRADCQRTQTAVIKVTGKTELVQTTRKNWTVTIYDCIFLLTSISSAKCLHPSASEVAWNAEFASGRKKQQKSLWHGIRTKLPTDKAGQRSRAKSCVVGWRTRFQTAKHVNIWKRY